MRFRITGWHVCALLAVVAAAVRWPHFYRDVIEWDESTFILMGQSLRDGHLPYTELWDNKPPLCFVPFALAIWVFGKSIAAIRAVGVVFMIASAWLTYGIGVRFGGMRVGFVAGFFCILFVSYAPGGMATMSELIALAPLLGALVFALAESPRRWLGVGVCLALAMLVRTNLAVVAVVVMALVAYLETRRAAVEVVVGATVPWIVCAIPYVVTGRATLFIASVLIAPAAYALHGIARKITVVGAAALPVQRFERSQVYVIAFSAATLVSILVTGFGASHYWIQIHAFTALAAALVVERLLTMRWVPASLHYAPALLALIVALSADALSAEEDRETIFGSSVEVAQHIAARNPSHAPVLLFSNHLAYWLLGQEPLSKVMAHPTNLFRPAALHAAIGDDATTLSETKSVLAKNPLYIVRRKAIRFADTQPEALALIDKTLARDYVLETQIQGSYIYRRK